MIPDRAATLVRLHDDLVDDARSVEADASSAFAQSRAGPEPAVGQQPTAQVAHERRIPGEVQGERVEIDLQAHDAVSGLPPSPDLREDDVVRRRRPPERVGAVDEPDVGPPEPRHGDALCRHGLAPRLDLSLEHVDRPRARQDRQAR